MELDGTIGFDTPLDAVPHLARRAEELGLAGLWTAETRHDPFLPLALVAEHSARLEFGTAVAVAFARSPTATAQTAWDLAARSGGRFILGLGTQVRAHIERRFGMAWSGQPMAQLRDYVAVMRAIWHAWQSGEPVRHRGSHYRITLMTPFFSPPPIANPQIPIYLAGVGAGMCRLAGEIADGLIVHPLHTRRYLAEVVLPAVGDGAGRADRPISAVRLSGSVMVATNADEREQVREQIAFYASTPTYRLILQLHGWQDAGLGLSELARRGRWSEMPALVTDEMVDAFSITAPWRELADRLADRSGGQLDRVSLYRPFGLASDDLGWKLLVDGFSRRHGVQSGAGPS